MLIYNKLLDSSTFRQYIIFIFYTKTFRKIYLCLNIKITILITKYIKNKKFVGIKSSKHVFFICVRLVGTWYLLQLYVGTSKKIKNIYFEKLKYFINTSNITGSFLFTHLHFKQVVHLSNNNFFFLLLGTEISFIQFTIYVIARRLT